MDNGGIGIIMMRMKKIVLALSAILVAFVAPAFAANPFMDVPAGHWSYDAVAQLAAKGVVSGYPDGAFKGAQPATRYEMASVVARALAKVDAEKASKQDLDMLKKLVMEFKNELDALGVKVDKIDKRVAVIEDRLGGWKLRGQFWFDAAFAGKDDNIAASSYTGNGFDKEFRKETLYLTLTKQIDDKTSFYIQFRGGARFAGDGQTGRGDIPGFNIRDVWVDTKLPYDVAFRVGRLTYNPEREHGLYVDNDALFGNYRVDGFQFRKTWNNLTGTAVIGRNTEGMDRVVMPGSTSNSMNYALDLFWQPNEKFFGGVSGNWFVDDEIPAASGDCSLKTYDVYASFKFTPSVSLSGIYYWQNLPGRFNSTFEDSPHAWRAVLDVKQDVLKYTALRFEYANVDNTFLLGKFAAFNNDGTRAPGLTKRDPYSFGDTASRSASVSRNMPFNNQSTSFFFIRADQKWNSKWSTYLRYEHADFDTNGIDDASGYGVGVTYQYTPAIAFRLAYDNVDYGNSTAPGTLAGDEHVVLFRTVVNF